MEEEEDSGFEEEDDDEEVEFENVKELEVELDKWDIVILSIKWEKLEVVFQEDSFEEWQVKRVKVEFDVKKESSDEDEDDEDEFEFEDV